MSVTTTANPLTYQVRAVLADYGLHHSSNPEDVDTELNTHPNPSSLARNPNDWPTEHRRVPAHRAVNTELDQSERRVYQNGIERAFIGVMFTGVFLQSVSPERQCKRSCADCDTDDVESLERISGEGLECRI